MRTITRTQQFPWVKLSYVGLTGSDYYGLAHLRGGSGGGALFPSLYTVGSSALMNDASQQYILTPRCKLLDSGGSTIIDFNGTSIVDCGAYSLGYYWMSGHLYSTTYVQLPLSFEEAEDAVSVTFETAEVEVRNDSVNIPVEAELQTDCGDNATVIKSGTDTWVPSTIDTEHTITIS